MKPLTFWNDNGMLYDKAQEKYAKIRYPQHIFRSKRVFEMIDQTKGERFLDIGCGYGEALVYAQKKGFKAYGIDYAPSMVELARKKLKNSGIEVSLGDALDLGQFENSSFDVVCANQVYGYLPRSKESQYLGEANRVLKTGGYLITAEANNLFDILTFNKFTVKFYKEHLLSLSFKKFEMQTEIDFLLSMPKEPKTPKEGKGTYVDQLLDNEETKYSSHREQANSKAENPLDYPRVMKQYGFKLLDIAFYHFHAVPPLLFKKNPELEKKAIRLEDAHCRDWQGYFMASSFVTLSQKIL